MQEQSYINIPLNEKMEEFSKSNPRNLQGISLKNCIIISTPEFLSYSFIEPVINNDDVNFELVSIIEYSKNKHDKSMKNPVQILKRKLEFETYTRLPAKNIDQVEVKIQTNRKALCDAHIVEIRVQKKGKNHKSTFFIFTFDAKMVESKESIQTTKLKESKNFKQIVNRVFWLPQSKDLFLQLFSEQIIVYSWDGFQEQQKEFLKLKNLKINEPLVDCSFADNRSTSQKSFLIALGQSGNTYIFTILTPQQSEEIDDRQIFFRLEQIIATSQKFNWESIKAISSNFNKTEITILIKTAYIYKDDRRQPILKIYSLQQNEDNTFRQNLLIENVGKIERQKYLKFQVLSNSLVKNSLYYFYDKKLLKLKLHKQLQYISNRPNKKYNQYCPIDLEISSVFEFAEKQKTVFIHIGEESIFLLRKLIQQPIYSFSNIPLDIIQFQSNEQSIKTFVQGLIKKMKVQLSKIEKYQDPYQAKFLLQLSQTSSQQEINRFNEELGLFISKQMDRINQKKIQIANLESMVKKSSSRVTDIYSKKGILNEYMNRIQKNKKEIDLLLQKGNEGNNESEDKLDEISDMIDFIKGKDIDLSEELKQEFIRVIKKHEINVTEIINKLNDAQTKLKNNK